MKEKWLNFLRKLKNPPKRAKILTFILTPVFAAAALCMLLVDYESGVLAVAAYTLFGLAGVSLGYFVFLIIPLLPTAKRRMIEGLEKREFTRRMLKNFGFRTLVFAAVSLGTTVLFGLFNGFMGIYHRSIWYGALAAYYIALVALRGGLLSYKKKTGEQEGYSYAKLYFVSGIVLLVLNIALSSAIAQMIFSDGHFSYFGWTIFAFAAYAFYKITMSVVNFFKAKKQADARVQAIRNINVADAAVSILALQTALLNTFSDGSINVSLMNAFTGIAVSLFSVGLGVYMIIFGKRKMKEYKKETKEDEQKPLSI